MADGFVCSTVQSSIKQPHDRPPPTISRIALVVNREVWHHPAKVSATVRRGAVVDTCLSQRIFKARSHRLRVTAIVVGTRDVNLHPKAPTTGTTNIAPSLPLATSSQVQTGRFAGRHPAGPTTAVCDTLASSFNIAPAVRARAGLAHSDPAYPPEKSLAMHSSN